jgi:hypothetical protein
VPQLAQDAVGADDLPWHEDGRGSEQRRDVSRHRASFEKGRIAIVLVEKRFDLAAILRIQAHLLQEDQPLGALELDGLLDLKATDRLVLQRREVDDATA